MKALILIDIQNDFLPGGALPVPRGDELIEVANQLMPHFPLVVATQDWHPPDHCSFVTNHAGGTLGERREVDGLEQVLWPVHCVQNTQGARLSDNLDGQRIHHVVQKGTLAGIDSYSGFFDNGRRHATQLADYLRDKGATQLYLMGLATDYCVKFTALDARSIGFDTWLVEDGCRAIELQPGDAQRAIDEMRSAGVQVIRSEQLLEEL